MMTKETIEELSAFLDGEAKAPERIAEMLQKDPEAARYVAELRRLSERVRSLSPPAVNPAFSTRVLGRVREETARPSAWSRRPLVRLVGILAAAAVVLAVVGGAWLAGRQDLSSQSPMQVTSLDPDALTAIIEQRIASGEEISIEEDLMFMTAYPEPEDSELFAALFEETFLDKLSQTLSAETDLDVVIPVLDAPEAETFRGLLMEYQTRG